MKEKFEESVISNTPSKTSESTSYPDINQMRLKLVNAFDLKSGNEKCAQLAQSYNFNKKDEDKLILFESVLQYIFYDLKNTFILSYNYIKSLCTIDKIPPNGLSNIILELRLQKKYILSSELDNELFYQNLFPHLSKKEEGIISNIYNKLTNIFSFNFLGCGNNQYEQISRRTDINVDLLKNKEINNDEGIIEYNFFASYTDKIYDVMKNIFINFDYIMIYNDFIKELTGKLKISEKEPSIIDINNINNALKFLKGIKKIIIFEVKVNDENYKFIKLLKDINDSYNEKDNLFAKILYYQELVKYNINSVKKVILQNVEEAKKYLKNKNYEKSNFFLEKRKENDIIYENLKKVDKDLLELIKNLEKPNIENAKEFDSILKKFEEFESNELKQIFSNNIY